MVSERAEPVAAEVTSNIEVAKARAVSMRPGLQVPNDYYFIVDSATVPSYPSL